MIDVEDLSNDCIYESQVRNVETSKTIWSALGFRQTPSYDTEIPSVQTDFGNEGIHVIQDKPVQI